ncbi:DUF4007 family protein [Nonomuraea sp. SYSU D8015]|uniref:DUF4007 family protein n=1 Tax=Nonomuraea sp. SYSU D8015 TaxID=2593644 RepID=UPI00166090DA|nr:DUF4007 family protein [Nonomuraea sp. SYSU D8015]
MTTSASHTRKNAVAPPADDQLALFPMLESESPPGETLSPLAKACEPTFGAHKEQPPLLNWLYKAYIALAEDPAVFAAKDAPIVFGVGKSQVQALRFWMQAFKLALGEVTPGAPQRLLLTDRAHWLLHDLGADPFLEEDGTLWLLHYWMLSTPCLVPTWWTVLQHPLSRTSRRDLTENTMRQAREAGWKPSESAVRRDVDCLVRMYAREASRQRDSIEDDLLRVFTRLPILQLDQDIHQVRLPRGPRFSLPPAILAYICLDYAHHIDPRPGALSIHRLTREPGSPGSVLRMWSDDLERALETDVHDDLCIMDSIGGDVLAFRRPPLQLAWEILDSHYNGVRERLGMRLDLADETRTG